MDSSSASSNIFAATTNVSSPAIIVADDQGTAAPPPVPIMHANPYEAAKDIRRKTRELIQHVLSFVPVQQTGGSALTQAKSHLSYTSGFVGEQQTYLDRLTLQRQEAEELAYNVAAAIEKRRAVDGREALRVLRRKLSDIDMTVQRCHSRHRRIREYVAAATNELEHVGTPPQSNNEAQKQAIQNLCDELHVLAQALPTFPNSPMAPADNVLRAMASLLKNGGYLESSSEYVKVLAAPDPNLESDFDEDELEEMSHDNEEGEDDS